MTYNRFLYNSALYNAGREEVGGVARSIIQAHTGPHIQAVVGSSGGVTFLSDFNIIEGAVSKPPTSFKFPDLSASIKAVFSGVDPLNAFIRGFAFRDLPACIFPSDKVPDLPASIFGLFESVLSATITGELGEKDLAALINVTVENLPAVINELLDGATQPFAPNLPAVINEKLAPGQKLAPTLGAMIHTPLDLAAQIQSVQNSDVGGSIFSFQQALLGGKMLGISAPSFNAYLKGFASETADLPTRIQLSPVGAGVLPAAINPSLGGETGFRVGFNALINSSGGYNNLSTVIKGIASATQNMGASIQTAGEGNLPAVISLFGALNIPGYVGAIPLGERDKQLSGFCQPVNPSNLAATMTVNQNVAFLSASIISLHGTADLGGFLRVAETFVTAILKVSTLSGRDLRATIGNPICGGGTGNYNLSAYARAQQARDLKATIQSFIERDLSAGINTTTQLHAFDTIDFSFTPAPFRTPTPFNSTDTLVVNFSPFRGLNLGATITAILPNVDLPATLTATFPLPRAVPSVSRLTAADLRLGEEQNIQEIRLQLEGQLQEYFYVNGTDQAFIRDARQDWKINIRSFRPIADNLFGDFAAARVCRLGDLRSFATLDQAVRFCIDAVIGLTSVGNLSASITGTGDFNNLGAAVGISNTFDSFTAKVFPTANAPQLAAYLNPANFNNNLAAFLHPVGVEASADLSASIKQESQLDMNALVNYPSGAQGLSAKILNAVVPKPGQFANVRGTITGVT